MSTPLLALVVVAIALVAGLHYQRQNDVNDQKPIIVAESGKNKWNRVIHHSAGGDSSSSWPAPRLAHAAASIGDYDMYVFGGLQGGTTPATSPPKLFNDLWRYDELHDRWTEIRAKEGSPVPAPRFHHTLSASHDGKKLILFGGFDGFVSNPSHKAIDDGIWLFDIASNTWENIATQDPQQPGPSARSSHETVVVGDSVYLFGGFAKIGVNFDGADELWKFSLKTRTWKKLGSSSDKKNHQWPEGRIGFPMVLLNDDNVDDTKVQMYLGFGACASKGQCNDEWLLEVDTSNDGDFTWTPLATTGDTPSPRRAPHADVSIHGHLFLYGGLLLSGPPGSTIVKEKNAAAEAKPAPIPEIFDDFYVLDTKTLAWKKIALEGTFAEGTRPPPVFGHTCVKIKEKMVLFGGRTSSLASPGSNEIWEFEYSEKY